MKHIFDKVTLAIWQCKTKGKQIKVKDILNDTESDVDKSIQPDTPS